MEERKAKKVLEEIKKTYDSIAQEFSQSRQFIGKEFELFKPYLQENQNIVDLGCGNGRLLYFLHKELKKFHYIGIDNSEELLKEAQKIHSDQKFIHGDQTNIPLPDEKFDLLFNIRAFHHLPTEKLQLQALSEMKRILKKKGILIITVWNLWQKKYLKELFRAFYKSIFTFGQYSFRDTFIPWNKKEWRYYHAFTTRKLKKLILQSGFKIVQFIPPQEQKKLNIHDYIVIAQKI